MERKDDIEKEEFCMTAGKPNMVYTFECRKDTLKKLPVITSERIAKARANVLTHTKKK